MLSHSVRGMKLKGSTSLPLSFGALTVGIFSLLLLKIQGQITAGWASSFSLASMGFQSKDMKDVLLCVTMK